MIVVLCAIEKAPIVHDKSNVVRAHIAGNLNALICADWLVINK
jgi:hypothetical protein